MNSLDKISEIISSETPGLEVWIGRSKEHQSQHPEDVRLSAEFSAKRRQEFRAGRYAARELLRRLGKDDGSPILVHESGQPLFPEGLCGSISHAKDLAAAALSSSYKTIGIDVEMARDTKKGFAERIGNPSEELSRWEEDSSRMPAQPVAIFSMKEAALKALSPLSASPLNLPSIALEGLTVRSRNFPELKQNTESPEGFESSGSFTCSLLEDAPRVCRLRQYQIAGYFFSVAWTQ